MPVLIRFAISQILKWAYSLKSEDFAAAWKFVLEAQQKFTESSNKRQWVGDQLKNLLGSRGSARAINFLIELAVARLGK